MQLRWRQFRRLLRWHSVLFPLVAAGAAAIVTLIPITHGGNQWCNSSSYSCSVSTNLLGVILIGGATSYWYYGFRRGRLLARHRRAVLARLRRGTPPDDELPAEDTARDAAVAAVLARYRNWRSQPPVTVVAGLPGSGKTVFLAEVVRRLASSHSWYVPVPLDDVAGGGEQDILDAAQRQLDIGLQDASINPGLIESLGRSLIRSRRLMIVIDDIDRIGPALSSFERALVVQRLMSSAQQLDVPLLATARSGSVESIAGSVIELPPPSADFLSRRISRAHGVPVSLKRLLLSALTGPLATPLMLDRIISLARRDTDPLATALRQVGPETADLTVWHFLLQACEVPGAVLTAQGLELVAYVLLITGQREIRVGAGPEWQQAILLGAEAGLHLPAHSTGLEEIAAYVDGGFLDGSSSPVMLQFPSPDVQAILAAQFITREPGRVEALIPQLGTSASARQAIAAALRSKKAAESAHVHTRLLAALNGSVPLPAAAHAAGLSLAIRHPPPGWDGAEMDELAGKLALVLADRVTAANGPALGVMGLRDAVQALATADRSGHDRHLLTALHSSSFQVRLSVALALIRRGTWDLIASTVEKWIAQAEAPDRTGVQHQLGLALWFCPHLATVDPTGHGADLYARGTRLSASSDSNPLMFEISLARGFKIAAWASPDLPVDAQAIALLQSGLRFWYSRVCLIHAIGIRLASPDGQQATANADLLQPAEEALAAATTDPHPLVREAARITRDSLAAGREIGQFCWLAESDMGRSNYQLGDEAMRLLGDVSLLLNLTYCAEPWSEPEWRLLGTTNQLPSCIHRPAARQQYMTSGCPRDCPLQLCPYPSPSRRPRGRGELSAAFCQAQHDVAERLGPAPWHEGRSAQPQVDFWLYAEQSLANRDGWEINL